MFVARCSICKAPFQLRVGLALAEVFQMVMGSIPTGDAVTVLHSRGTLSMREMSL